MCKGFGRVPKICIRDNFFANSNAALISSGEEQERSFDGLAIKSHSAFEPHLIQGWTPDFIPLVLQESIDNKLFDEIIKISGKESISTSIKLAQKEGISLILKYKKMSKMTME